MGNSPSGTITYNEAAARPQPAAMIAHVHFGPDSSGCSSGISGGANAAGRFISIECAYSNVASGNSTSYNRASSSAFTFRPTTAAAGSMATSASGTMTKIEYSISVGACSELENDCMSPFVPFKTTSSARLSAMVRMASSRSQVELFIRNMERLKCSPYFQPLAKASSASSRLSYARICRSHMSFCVSLASCLFEFMAAKRKARSMFGLSFMDMTM